MRGCVAPGDPPAPATAPAPLGQGRRDRAVPGLQPGAPGGPWTLPRRWAPQRGGGAGPGPASWHKPPGSQASSFSDLPFGRQPEILPGQRPEHPPQKSSAAPQAGVQVLQPGRASRLLHTCAPTPAASPLPGPSAPLPGPRLDPHPSTAPITPAHTPPPPTHTAVLRRAGLQRTRTHTRTPPAGGPGRRPTAADALVSSWRPRWPPPALSWGLLGRDEPAGGTHPPALPRGAHAAHRPSCGGLLHPQPPEAGGCGPGTRWPHQHGPHRRER